MDDHAATNEVQEVQTSSTGDHAITEEKRLQQENQSLRNKAEGLQKALELQNEVIRLLEVSEKQKEELISLQRERIELQDEANARLRQEVARLNKQLRAMEGLVATGSDASQSGGFPRPSKKSLLKKQRRKRG